mmetsp:Transcript_16566/g.23188  ORF Transcript_16566/g.23188 Transcript_16566/m.23188 type:complete len:115 (-) Transcript_16566:1022-1366(-)
MENDARVDWWNHNDSHELLVQGGIKWLSKMPKKKLSLLHSGIRRNNKFVSEQKLKHWKVCNGLNTDMDELDWGPERQAWRSLFKMKCVPHFDDGDCDEAMDDREHDRHVWNADA